MASRPATAAPISRTSSTLRDSVESFTPFWSIWDPSQSAAGSYWPRRDDELQLLALEAVYEYWVTDGNNETSGSGVPMIQAAFMSVWNWDARPFPTFPQMAEVWGDTGNWPAGNWLGGKGPFLTPLVPDDPPEPGPYGVFPAVPTLGWSVHYSPIFSTGAALHVSGREVRAAKYVSPLWEIELNFDLLRMASPNTELQQIIGFFEECEGEATSFYFEPPTFSPVAAQPLGTGDGSTTIFPFTVSIGGATLSLAGSRDGLRRLSQRHRTIERVHRQRDAARAIGNLRHGTGHRRRRDCGFPLVLPLPV